MVFTRVDASNMPKNKFPEQAETIERVKTILNLSDEALALEVSVRPETMQKYAAGYQKAGGKLMQIIARLPETYHRTALRGSGVSPEPIFSPGGSRADLDPGLHSLQRDVRLDPPSAQEQLAQSSPKARWTRSA